MPGEDEAVNVQVAVRCWATNEEEKKSSHTRNFYKFTRTQMILLLCSEFIFIFLLFLRLSLQLARAKKVSKEVGMSEHDHESVYI